MRLSSRVSFTRPRSVRTCASCFASYNTRDSTPTILRRFVRSSQSTGGNKDVENLHTSFEAFSNFRGLVLGITRNTNSRFSQFELSVVNFTMLYSKICILSGHPLLSGGIAHFVSNVSSHDILSKTKTCILSGHLNLSRIVTTIKFLMTKLVHNHE